MLFLVFLKQKFIITEFVITYVMDFIQFSTDEEDLEKFNDEFTALQCKKTEKYNPEKLLQAIPNR